MTELEPTFKLLGRVIDVAERTLGRPATGRHDEAASVMTSLRERHDANTATPKRTHFAVMLIEAVLHLQWTRLMPDQEGVRWAMIAGALLPCVRADMALALDDERERAAAAAEIDRDLMSTTQERR